MTQDYASWIGKSVTETQRADIWPGRAMAAVLDKSFTAEEGDAIPPLAHWTYFTPMVPQSKIGFDGHPERGDFIPPFPQPRRMWAASDITFHAPIRFGDMVERRSEIASIEHKAGSTGDLVFLKLRNDYSVNGTECLSETQTIVYRDPPAPDEVPRSKPAPENAQWSDKIETSSARLFRYSAVTFNAHRIHYDHPYATQEEGYPGVIVQGQFIATTLLEAFQAAHPNAAVKSFSFRAVKPIFSGEEYFTEGLVEGEHVRLWARGSEEDLRMQASIVA